MDAEGVEVDAVADACKKLKPKALYLNPTLQNPTTITISDQRRRDIAPWRGASNCRLSKTMPMVLFPRTARPRALPAIAPDLTWHVAGLAKCIGAGLRAAYVVVPDTRSIWPFASALRPRR